MIEYNGKKFYSSYEIYNMLKPVYSDRLNTAWKLHYNKYCRSDVQNILDKGRKCELLKFLKYTTQPEGGQNRYVYSLEDLVDFVEKGIPERDLTTSSGVYNIEYKEN